MPAFLPMRLLRPPLQKPLPVVTQRCHPLKLWAVFTGMLINLARPLGCIWNQLAGH